jgi:MFS family permease
VGTSKTDTPGILDLRDKSYRLAMLNGWLVLLGDAFFNGSIVLASFAAKLGAANWVVGLLPALLTAGSMVPQVFLASYVARLPVKVVLYRRMAMLRVASLGLVALGGFFLGHKPELLLWVFVVGLGLNGLFTGFSSLPFWETIAKTIPMERRASLFSMRNLVGGALAFLAGLLVRQVLELPLPFPYPYAILFTLGTLAFAYGWHLFGQIDEPPDKEVRKEELSLTLPFRDFYFRRFLRVRVLLAIAGMVEPFYAAYAVRNLGHKGEVGIYLMVYTSASVLSNLLWVRLSRRFGSRSLILIGAALGALTPALALLLPASLFWVVFALQGAYLSAIGVGTATYLVNLAPTEARSSYIGLSNTIVGLLSFSPVLGGLLADRVGYAGPMLVAAVCYAWALYAGRRLKLLEAAAGGQTP